MGLLYAKGAKIFFLNIEKLEKHELLAGLLVGVLGENCENCFVATLKTLLGLACLHLFLEHRKTLKTRNPVGVDCWGLYEIL